MSWKSHKRGDAKLKTPVKKATGSASKRSMKSGFKSPVKGASGKIPKKSAKPS